ncbi:MAG TPA: hypothetical protein DIW80_02020 [Gordonia polyisoprenivorans]|nr:hypothetical protein [Gordonia polyisoprenivorans]
MTSVVVLVAANIIRPSSGIRRATSGELWSTMSCQISRSPAWWAAISASIGIPSAARVAASSLEAASAAGPSACLSPMADRRIWSWRCTADRWRSSRIARYTGRTCRMPRVTTAAISGNSATNV